MNSHFSKIPYFFQVTIHFKKLFSSWLKCPKCSFAVVTLYIDAFWSSVSCFGTHLALTLLIPIFSSPVGKYRRCTASSISFGGGINKNVEVLHQRF